MFLPPHCLALMAQRRALLCATELENVGLGLVLLNPRADRGLELAWGNTSHWTFCPHIGVWHLFRLGQKPSCSPCLPMSTCFSHSIHTGIPPISFSHPKPPPIPAGPDHLRGSQCPVRKGLREGTMEKTMHWAESLSALMHHPLPRTSVLKQV